MTDRRGTSFREVMTGTVRLAGEDRARPVRLELTAHADGLLRVAGTTRARLTGRVRIAGRADDAYAQGELEISPLARRRIRYRLHFQLDGRRCTLDGWKSVTPRHPVRSMTTLPYSLLCDGTPVGQGTLRFRAATRLLPFLASFRFPRLDETSSHSAPRWDGTPGRTEVWYTTLTDPRTGTGVWLHHELTAPADGSPAFGHGWIALFPADAPPRHARFGPRPWPAGGSGFALDSVSAEPGRLRGKAGDFSWDLTEQHRGRPLFTFPRWAWRSSALPAAQILPSSHAVYSGTVTSPGGDLLLTEAPGAGARIYGHGNARRWAWLHADLGDGAVLEIVAATSTRPGLDRLPPLVFLRLRQGTRTWPRYALRPAVGWAGAGRFRARIDRPTWQVTGRAGGRRIHVTVTLPPERTLSLGYTDPDGSRATCHNSESADARILLERRRGGWHTEAEWTLSGTAHAEVGER